MWNVRLSGPTVIECVSLVFGLIWGGENVRAKSLDDGDGKAPQTVVYAGVNLAGAEFSEDSLPGVYGVDYVYPTQAEVDYFVDKGMNIFRLPFRWERLQHSLFGDLDGVELGRLDRFVHYATGQGASVILDPHNFARYYGKVIGGPDVPAAAFADFWGRLAAHYKENDRVIFGLMNEPHDMPTELWRRDANAAIAAIRSIGASNLVLVPGNGWTGAHSWGLAWYGTPNAVEMLKIVDPWNTYAFEVHQYLDGDASGTSSTCVSETIGTECLEDFTQWLRWHGRRGFLAEFGGGRNETCYAALDNMLSYIDDNIDVWLGWAYWAAGPKWRNYAFTLEPVRGQDRPQMAYLSPYIPTGPVRPLGDVTGNGIVTAHDAVRTLQHTVGLLTLTDEDSVAADATENDAISAYDAALALHYDIDRAGREGVRTTSTYVTVWIGESEISSDGQVCLPIFLDDMDGVVGGEITLSFDGRPGDVTVETSRLTSDYLVASNLQEESIRISFAGAGSIPGSGTVLEIIFDSTDAELTRSVRLRRIALNEGKIPVRVVSRSEIPKVHRLAQSYPNPFNSTTTLAYDLAKTGAVRLEIYSVTGQRVRTLVEGERLVGSHSLIWDGRNDAGRGAASGVYLARMEAGAFRAVRKIMLVR